MIKRLLVWSGTFLGIGVGIVMILAVFFDDRDLPIWIRLGQGAIGCYLVWVLGSGLLKSLKERARRT